MGNRIRKRAVLLPAFYLLFVVSFYCLSGCGGFGLLRFWGLGGGSCGGGGGGAFFYEADGESVVAGVGAGGYDVGAEDESACGVFVSFGSSGPVAAVGVAAPFFAVGGEVAYGWEEYGADFLHVFPLFEVIDVGEVSAAEAGGEGAGLGSGPLVGEEEKAVASANGGESHLLFGAFAFGEEVAPFEDGEGAPFAGFHVGAPVGEGGVVGDVGVIEGRVFAGSPAEEFDFAGA